MPIQIHRHRSNTVLVLLLSLLLLLSLSCDGAKNNIVSLDTSVGSVAIDIALPEVAGATDALAKVHKNVLTQGRFRISGEGMTPINTTVAAVNNRLTGRLEGIPVGQRTVALFLLDASKTELWHASTTVTVVANA
jgi:hypothetical protein